MADANFASLSPSLLARKGGAKPAMRPQHAVLASMPHATPADFATFTTSNETLDDLGWNDMGEERTSQPAEPIYLTPAPHNPDADARSQADDHTAERQLNGQTGEIRRPVVVEQQAALARAVAGAARADAAADAAGQKPGKRVAFTLRLDAERHLKLKLASAINNCSAQQLVTEALDALIANMPELEMLASQVKQR